MKVSLVVLAIPEKDRARAEKLVRNVVNTFCSGYGTLGGRKARIDSHLAGILKLLRGEGVLDDTTRIREGLSAGLEAWCRAKKRREQAIGRAEWSPGELELVPGIKDRTIALKYGTKRRVGHWTVTIDCSGRPSFDGIAELLALLDRAGVKFDTEETQTVYADGYAFEATVTVGTEVAAAPAEAAASEGEEGDDAASQEGAAP